LKSKNKKGQMEKKEMKGRKKIKTSMPRRWHRKKDNVGK
jgi:hypothetical protein